MGERIARVFPRRTNMTPDDGLAFVGHPPPDPPEVDAVHVSVSWSYDMQEAESLAHSWKHIGPCSIGGPACGDPGGEFLPGQYVKHGYVMTSRGCPNNCWFCDVPRREGRIVRELKVHDGWNILDSNLLACSKDHVMTVFEMLKRQDRKIEFTGGFEAARLEWWHVAELWDVRPDQMFFAYDTPDDLDPLIEAGNKLRMADFTRRHLRCYVLIGHPRDTFAAAEARLLDAWMAGFMPMAMLWKSKNGHTDPQWSKFRNTWARPANSRAWVKASMTKEWRDD